jgi:hypothetical protein
MLFAPQNKDNNHNNHNNHNNRLKHKNQDQLGKAKSSSRKPSCRINKYQVQLAKLQSWTVMAAAKLEMTKFRL